jgi:hypothetical protein
MGRSQYIAAARASALAARLYEAVCRQEWGAGCEELLARVGELQPGGAGGSARLRELWVMWVRARRVREAELAQQEREREEQRVATEEGTGSRGVDWRRGDGFWAGQGPEDSDAGLHWMAPGWWEEQDPWEWDELDGELTGGAAGVGEAANVVSELIYAAGSVPEDGCRWVERGEVEKEMSFADMATGV